MASDRPLERPRGVHLSAVVIAQDAFRDERGRTHIIGVFDRLSAVTFPLITEFMVWCNIKGHGRATISLRLSDGEKSELMATDPLIAEVTPFKGHEWFVTVNVTFPHPGLYKLEGLVDKRPLIDVPLMVWQTEAAPADESELGPGTTTDD